MLKYNNINIVTIFTYQVFRMASFYLCWGRGAGASSPSGLAVPVIIYGLKTNFIIKFKQDRKTIDISYFIGREGSRFEANSG